MNFVIKLSLSILVIIVCTTIAKRFPSMAGLIATMPLAGLIVLVWVYSDVAGNPQTMVRYTRGALFGIIPSILFYATALVCFGKHIPLAWALAASFGVWLAGAVVHQWLLR